jgi:putative toxin-antitoxin system antitoxin component (TIGR02293 family)
MKQRNTPGNPGKAKKPVRQRELAVAATGGGSKKRSKPPDYAGNSEFDTATGLKVLSDRVYDPDAGDAPTPPNGLSGVHVTVKGPLVQMDPSALKALHGFTDEEIYHLVVPKRTLARRTAEKQPLSVEETDRAVRLARVGKIAETVFGNVEKAHRWLRKPKPSLEGETPLNYLVSETGARVVEEMLTRIDHGILP